MNNTNNEIISESLNLLKKKKNTWYLEVESFKYNTLWVTI